jgi:hypothetical protein
MRITRWADARGALPEASALRSVSLGSFELIASISVAFK